MSDVEMTDVMFRVDRAGELFALMPALPGTNEPHTCTSYQHVGQHSSADLRHCINTSRRAEPEEFAPLKRELEGRGYAVNVIQRATRRHDQARLKALKAYH